MLRTEEPKVASIERQDFCDSITLDFSHANLSHACISNGVLYGANLTMADLSYTILESCSLSETNLSGATFAGTIIGYEFDLTQANLTDVDLSQAMIELPGGIDNPRIKGAILRNTILPDGTKVIFSLLPF
ncbi:pentapeptide repeat-containing protein [Altericista sp. CCNU0014]|uniref:pentapeptide repeat-containing protein n=1 Tax=Altericista sp. CCNU0014 TaxID=3082949 RepID=UPI0038505018